MGMEMGMGMGVTALKLAGHFLLCCSVIFSFDVRTMSDANTVHDINDNIMTLMDNTDALYGWILI